MIEIVKLPEERKAVIIGKNANVKKTIEVLTETEITIKDDVSIEGEDPIGIMDAKNIITAIGRGFSPDKAKKLSGGENILEIISLRDMRSPKKRLVQKGRIIGTKGRARKLLERFTRCDISVYGDTVSIIGPWDAVNFAKDAVSQLLEGKSHATVYRFLEKEGARSKSTEANG
ncbi:MAG: KH domain-containing protein [Candidatus Aenigmatarchaeota archaeon]